MSSSCSAGAELPKAEVMVVTDATFKGEVLESKIPVAVHFWAPWCGPCKMFRPVIEPCS